MSAQAFLPEKSCLSGPHPLDTGTPVRGSGSTDPGAGPHAGPLQPPSLDSEGFAAVPIDVVCKCGRISKAPDEAAGRKGRCRGCGAIVVIPGTIPEVDLTAIPLVDSTPDPKPGAFGLGSMPPGLWPPVGAAAYLGARTPVELEPWYYSRIVLIGIVYLQIATIASELSIVLSLASLVVGIIGLSGASNPAYAVLIMASLYFMLTAIGCYLSSRIFIIPLLIAVDIARNLRAIRYAGVSSEELRVRSKARLGLVGILVGFFVD